MKDISDIQTSARNIHAESTTAHRARPKFRNGSRPPETASAAKRVNAGISGKWNRLPAKKTKQEKSQDRRKARNAVPRGPRRTARPSTPRRSGSAYGRLIA